MTTELAPIFAPWPTVIGPSSLAPEPIVTLSLDRRVALAGREAGAAERDALVERDVVADLGRLADHDAHAVVDEQPVADAARPGGSRCPVSARWRRRCARGASGTPASCSACATRWASSAWTPGQAARISSDETPRAAGSRSCAAATSRRSSRADAAQGAEAEHRRTTVLSTMPRLRALILHGWQGSGPGALADAGWRERLRRGRRPRRSYPGPARLRRAVPRPLGRRAARASSRALARRATASASSSATRWAASLWLREAARDPPGAPRRPRRCSSRRRARARRCPSSRGFYPTGADKAAIDAAARPRRGWCAPTTTPYCPGRGAADALGRAAGAARRPAARRAGTSTSRPATGRGRRWRPGRWGRRPSPAAAERRGSGRREERRRDVALAGVGQHHDDPLALRLRALADLQRAPTAPRRTRCRPARPRARRPGGRSRSRPRRRPAMTSSMTSRSSTGGTKPAPMPWIRCGPGRAAARAPPSSRARPRSPARRGCAP